MRRRIASALLVAVVLAASPPAPAFDRNEIGQGDVAFGDIVEPYSFDEFPIRMVSGAFLKLAVSGVAPRPLKPALGLYSDDYGDVPLVGTSLSSAGSLNSLATATYRILVGGAGASVGSYRLKATVRPTKSFIYGGGAGGGTPRLDFGAYAGFAFTVSFKWKGPTPVTLTSVVGPDGAPVDHDAVPPRASKASFTQAGYHAALSGDYAATLNVPADCKSWSALVQVTGKLPPGTTHDFRSVGGPTRPTISYPSPGRFPVVAIIGEHGGPNDCVLSARGASPDVAFVDGGAGAGGCSLFVADASVPPKKYVLRCNDGFNVDVEDVVRYADGPWTGFIQSYEAKNVRSPQGTGSATLEGFEYDATGRPTKWTERRRFDSSGREHRLTFERVEFFSNGFAKAYRVTESLLVGGLPAYVHTEDYAPFR